MRNISKGKSQKFSGLRRGIKTQLSSSKSLILGGIETKFYLSLDWMGLLQNEPLEVQKTTIQNFQTRLGNKAPCSLNRDEELGNLPWKKL